MRFRGVFLARTASVFLLSAALLCAATPAGEARIVNPFAAPRSLLSPAANVSPYGDDGRLAFASEGEIYLVDPDGGGLTQLTYSGPGVYNYQPALSPDGTRVAFASISGDKSSIKVVDTNGGNLRSLTSNALSHDSEPAWSPDGSKVAFVRGFDPTADGVANHTTCGFEIYAVDVDDGHEVSLTRGLGGTDPSWSPDGERVAFASDREGSFDIYTMTADGEDVKRLTAEEGNEAEPAWSPDGKVIAYAGDLVDVSFYCGFAHTGLARGPNPTGPDIYVISSEGTEQERLTFTEDSIEPAWSPDGVSLAFVSWRGDAPQVYVLHSPGKRAHAITSDPAHKSSPSWGRAAIVR